MEELKGNIVDSVPFKGLEKIADLLFFEGPILTHFTDSNNDNLFFYWVDFDNRFNRWLVFNVSDAFLYKYLHKTASLRDLLLTNQLVFTIDIDSDVNYNNIQLINIHNLNSSYIPEESSIYQDNIPQVYNNIFTDDNSPSFYLERLREHAVYIKIDPKNKNGTSAVYADDAGDFLTNLSDSFISYLGIDFKKNFNGNFTNSKKLTKVANKIKKDFRPRLVYSEYGSFSVALAPETVNKESSQNPQLSYWVKDISKKYKKEILESNFADEDVVNSLVEKFTPTERKEIFLPLIQVFNNEDYNTSISDDFLKTTKPLIPISVDVTSKLIEISKDKIAEKGVLQLGRLEVFSKRKPRILGLFDQKIQSSYETVFIKIGEGKGYELKFPLRFKYEIIGEIHYLEAEFLGILAQGHDLEEAEQMFSEEFDFIYQRYNSLSNEQLTEDVINIKNYLNWIVKHDS